MPTQLAHPVSVLLVDDNAHNIVALKAALGGLDANVVTAGSGSDALKLLLDQDVAVIVLDIHMPVLDGFETARLIRGRKRSQSTPIIFVTAYDPAGARALAGYQLGAVDYLYTPIDPAVLRAKIEVFVELFRTTAALTRQTAELNLVIADLIQRERQVVALNTDLLQRERQIVALNAELLQRTSELELAGKHKSEFLTGMSHELRTPLSAIIGFSEIMLDHDLTEIPNELRHTYLDHIQRSGQYLLGLVNDILDLAKVEAGYLELSLERIHLQDVIVGCVDVIRALADPKLLTLSRQCEPSDAVVTADPARLQQILYNLLSNAVKFTPTGGQITVSARVNSIEAVIAVHDNGIGIGPEDEAFIFQPFRQLQVAPHRQEGTGLGLPLVRELVELHGGRIWLGSVPGSGSCFTFTLPHATTRTSPPRPPSRRRLWSPGSERRERRADPTGDWSQAASPVTDIIGL